MNCPGLNKRETQVLNLIIQGYTYQQMAAHLGISIKTINNYTTGIRYKWQCDSLMAIVRVALRNGVISLEEFLACTTGENTRREPPAYLLKKPVNQRTNVSQELHQ